MRWSMKIDREAEENRHLIRDGLMMSVPQDVCLVAWGSTEGAGEVTLVQPITELGA